VVLDGRIGDGGMPPFALGPLDGPPTVFKSQPLSASRLSASLASRCRAKASRIHPA
jgi:hypothetical protein